MSSTDTNTVGGFLNSIPFSYAIGAPLKAIVEAQGEAAKSTIDFIQQVGFEQQSGSGSSSTSTTSKVRTVDFSMEKNGQTVDLKAPLLSMVNVPFIRIQQAVINLDCQIDSVNTTSDAEQTQKDVKAGGSGGFLFWKASASVNVTYTSQKNKKGRIDKSGEIKINVIATQDDVPEGLRLLLNILRDSIDGSAKQAKTA